MQNLSDRFGNFLITSLELFAAAFILVIGAIVLWAVVAYILDVTQTRHAIRRNYLVIGRFATSSSTSASSFASIFRHGPRGAAVQPRRAFLGPIAPLRTSTTRWPSARRATCGARAPCCSSTALSRRWGRRRATATGDHRTGLPHPYTTASLFNISGMSCGRSPNRRYRHCPAGHARPAAG